MAITSVFMQNGEFFGKGLFISKAANLQGRALGRLAPAPHWLVAEVRMEASGAAAVIVTDQWVVSIYGDNADNCVEALLKYRDAIVTALDAKVTGISRAPEGPDFLVSNGRNRVVVKAKSYPVLLRPVVEAGRYAHRFNAPAVICVPDRAEVLDSVRKWAEDNNIFVSPIGQVAATLRKLLEAD